MSPDGRPGPHWIAYDQNQENVIGSFKVDNKPRSSNVSTWENCAKNSSIDGPLVKKLAKIYRSEMDKRYESTAHQKANVDDKILTLGSNYVQKNLLDRTQSLPFTSDSKRKQDPFLAGFALLQGGYMKRLYKKSAPYLYGDQLAYLGSDVSTPAPTAAAAVAMILGEAASGDLDDAVGVTSSAGVTDDHQQEFTGQPAGNEEVRYQSAPPMVQYIYFYWQ